MKRSPLRRGAPLEPGKPPVRRVPLRQVGVKVKANSAARKGGGSSSGKLIPPAPPEFTPRVKLLARRRAGRGDIFDAACEACGGWLGEKGGEFQHRDARGMGGSKDPVTNGPANAALLCGSGVLRTGCHGACENRDRDMLGRGFWLEEGQDPRITSVMVHGIGFPVFFAGDGAGDTGYGYSYSAPQIGADAA